MMSNSTLASHFRDSRFLAWHSRNCQSCILLDFNWFQLIWLSIGQNLQISNRFGKFGMTLAQIGHWQKWPKFNPNSNINKNFGNQLGSTQDNGKFNFTKGFWPSRLISWPLENLTRDRFQNRAASLFYPFWTAQHRRIETSHLLEHFPDPFPLVFF